MCVFLRNIVWLDLLVGWLIFYGLRQVSIKIIDESAFFGLDVSK